MRIQEPSCTWSGPYQEAFLANVKVNVFAALVSYKSTEVPSGNAMPDTFVSLLECALHVGSDQLLTARSIQSFLSLMDSELFHLIVHVD